MEKSIAPEPIELKTFRNSSRTLPWPSKPRLRYSPGLAPTTRLNALLNAASDFVTDQPGDVYELVVSLFELNCIAFCILHSVTYSESGVCPSSSLENALRMRSETHARRFGQGFHRP